MKIIRSIAGLLFIFSVSNNSLYAQLRLPAIIGDNMVIQRNVSVPVWGWAKPGDSVTVSFQQKKITTVTTTAGKWFLKTGPFKSGGPFEMRISDQTGHEIVLGNILIGDVWLASGQSNMEFGIQTDSRSERAIKNAGDSLIRFFYVPMSKSLEPCEDITKNSVNGLNGRWVICSPEVLSAVSFGWHGFSAIGYYFARGLRDLYRIPVGMIGSYKGGTPGQAWISLNGLQIDSSLSHYLINHEQLVTDYQKSKLEFEKKNPEYEAALSKWNKEIGKSYNQSLLEWESQLKQYNNAAPGTFVPERPKPSLPIPKQPISPDGGFGAPANLYNAMINPIVPFAIKGVIWYQGEGNGDRMADAREYSVLFPALINDWRKNWQQGNFPFLFVQLANYRAKAKTASEGIWPWVREAQSKALILKNTGMAVTTDLGEAYNIHPKDKYDVAYRLVEVARETAYGENLVASGPIFRSCKFRGNKVTIFFNHTGKGLIAANSPLMQDKEQEYKTVDLKGFGIAGADKKFEWAKVHIYKRKIVVFSENIPVPVAVRYNWGDDPPGNLYNKEGLPAPAFRTDQWDSN